MTPLPSQAAAPPDQTTCWTADVAALRPGAVARSWLTEPGLLTERVRGRCHAAFGLRIVGQRHGLLDAADARALGVTDLSAFFREIELACGDTALVFAQTLVPDATLAAEPITTYDGTHKGADSYRQLARELIARGGAA